MRKPSRPNEAAYQRALKKLARALKHPGDLSWQDDPPYASSPMTYLAPHRDGV